MSIDKRIADLEIKLKQAKAMRQKIEARKRAIETKKQRGLDTRRKILIGAAVMSQIERGLWSEDQLINLVDGYLTRVDDRALFNLKEKEATTTQKQEGQENTKSI